MGREAPIPDDVVHVELEVGVGPARPTFGFWMLWPGLAGGNAAWADYTVGQAQINLLQSFLNCMHTDANFRTCRLTVGGPQHFRYESTFAPNAGRGTAGQGLALAVGLYIQTSGGGRGSGSRLRIPGVANDMTDNFAYLSDYGEQQLVFAAQGLAGWPSTLLWPGTGTPVLGTLQRRDGDTYLHPAVFDPAQVVRPTLMLEILARRQKQVRGLPSS